MIGGPRGPGGGGVWNHFLGLRNAAKEEEKYYFVMTNEAWGRQTIIKTNFFRIVYEKNKVLNYYFYVFESLTNKMNSSWMIHFIFSSSTKRTSQNIVLKTIITEPIEEHVGNIWSSFHQLHSVRFPKKRVYVKQILSSMTSFFNYPPL